MWIQVKTGSGSLKRPTLAPLRGVWASLTVNPSFVAFRSVCMCICTCMCVLSSSGAEIWQPESDARGSHSEEPCRFPWGMLGAGKQVIACMAPNFTLLSSGEKGFLLSCSFCKKKNKKTGREHLNADREVPYKTDFLVDYNNKSETRGRKAFCPFVVSDTFQSE